MQRLERLYAINEYIRQHRNRPVSAADLAREFEVTRRTIERDLASLRAAGVPLYAEHGRTGGQQTLDTAGTVVVTFSTTEVIALVIALAASGPTMPFADSGERATRRLLDSLGEHTRFEIDALRRRVRTVDPTGHQSHRSNLRIRRTLEEAVRRTRVVNLTYTDGNGVRTDRSVDAVGFYCGGNDWYLIGWCHLRQAGRIFRLDRVTAARLTKRAAATHDVDETLGWVPHEVRAP